jgi:CheY-like chemotaxis protein
MDCKTVLIVEDDEVIRDVLQQLLQYQGYETLTANHGRDALEKLPNMAQPALLLMDLMMPVMNGWELLAELRRDPRWQQLPVIILSAGGEAQQLLEDPYVRFLKKPLRMNSLLQLVKTFCGELNGDPSKSSD